jgi:GGDEF domain-containing protein
MEDTKRRIVAGYAIFTLLFLSGVFVFTLFRIETLSFNNKDRVERVIDRLRENLVKKFSLKGNFAEREVSDLFRNALDEEDCLLVVVVSTRDYGILKAVGKSKDYFEPAQFNDLSRPVVFNKPLGTAELASDKTALTLTYNNLTLDARLNALYTSFSSRDAAVLLREILFLMLGFFTLTLIMIIVVSAVTSREDRIVAAAVTRRPPPEKIDLPEFPARRAAPPPTIAPQERGPSLQTPGTEEPIAGPDESAPVQFADIPELRDEAAGGGAAAAGSATAEDLSWSDEEREARKRERYSERSGLIRSEYLRERLGVEIERAESFDEDLALAFVSVSAARSGAGTGDESFASSLRQYFGGPELAFEYDPDTAAAVAPGMNIDAAIKAAKLLYKALFASGLRACVGITARNGRTVTPEAFLEEAAQALSQAKSGAQSPIIAFRAGA